MGDVRCGNLFGMADTESSMVNRRIILTDRPNGLVGDYCLKTVEAPVPEPGEGEAIVRMAYLSVDPTNRVWMREEDSYMPAVPIGDVVRAAGLGVVVDTRCELYAIGDLVLGLLGWQDYAVIDAGEHAANVIPPGLPATDVLSIFGSTGLTAWFGVHDVAKLQAGETFVISGAAGGVGSVAGQLARIAGARVIGIAGTDEKCRWVVEDLGFDACINYKTENVEERVAALCPDGVDVYFDNVGGEILDAVLANLAIGARVAVCGAISHYTAESLPPVFNTFELVNKRARMEGFLLLDYLDRFIEAIGELLPLVIDGTLVYAVEVVEGLENAPATLNRLFTGEHTGKLLVKVSDAAD